MYIPNSNLSYPPLISAGGSYDLLEDTIYWLKLYFTGTAYRLDYSLDGINYINDINVSSTTIMGVGTEGFCIGYDYFPNSTTVWNGLMYLKDCKITINNNVFWQGVKNTDIQITPDTLTGFAKENIANNMAGEVKTVLES
jgi:hypothetical protein